MPIAMRGAGGELRVGYAIAARLRRWEIVGDELVVHEADVDPFWGEAEGRRSVHLAFGRSWWVWRDAEVLSMEMPLRVRLVGSPVTRPKE
ncbi:MAG TPA: hypothetical protein VFN64_11525 [Burkholderiaceae bacterium]|nr:hypothetical protein [Burkholderiaceae bacterium]